MQTFLPYADFEQTAKCLDYKRLGKQRVEAFQILNALANPKNRWNKHPIVKMWRGYENCLKLYFNIISYEWIKRGYKHNMGFYLRDNNTLIFPQFIGDEEFHSSHRAALLFKNYNWYKQFEWAEIPQINYKWKI